MIHAEKATMTSSVCAMSHTRSIILKQKIDIWARRTRGMGFTPVVKLSHHEGVYGVGDQAVDGDGSANEEGPAP